MATPADEHLEIVYHGRVQGVGFRARTRAIAARFDVRGTVENLDDGQVRLRVAGPAEEVVRFVDAVAEELRRCIVGAERRRLAEPADYVGFQIIR